VFHSLSLLVSFCLRYSILILCSYCVECWLNSFLPVTGAISDKFQETQYWIKICDSSAGIALGYGLDDRGSRVRFPAGAGNFSLRHRVKNVSGAHPASYPMGTRCSFPGGKAARVWNDHSPPCSAEVKEWEEPYLHSPSMPAWRGDQLKHRDNFTFYLYCIRYIYVNRPTNIQADYFLLKYHVSLSTSALDSFSSGISYVFLHLVFSVPGKFSDKGRFPYNPRSILNIYT
jgi:hypothetical protein